MIAMCGSDRPGEVVWNHNSFFAPTWTVDSTTVQAQRFSDSLPFGGMLKA